MTTYTYKCLDCGNVSEIKATLQEKEEGKGDKFFCRKCKSKNIRHKFSLGHFIKNVFRGHEKTPCCSGSDKKEDTRCCKSKKDSYCG